MVYHGDDKTEPTQTAATYNDETTISRHKLSLVSTQVNHRSSTLNIYSPENRHLTDAARLASMDLNRGINHLTNTRWSEPP